MEDEVLCKVLVICVLFDDAVGQPLVCNGSKGCLGWVAAGGDSESEATENLSKILAKIEVEVDGECMAVPLL